MIFFIYFHFVFISGRADLKTLAIPGLAIEPAQIKLDLGEQQQKPKTRKGWSTTERFLPHFVLSEGDKTSFKR